MSNHQYSMRISRHMSWIAPFLGFTLLTGAFGLLPPSIPGLGECGDYCGGRFVLVIIPVTLFLIIWAVCIGYEHGLQWGGPIFLWACAVFGSALLNEKILDQDPIGAWLNWKSPFLDYDPEWGRSIENHEHIYRDAETGAIVAGHGA